MHDYKSNISYLIDYTTGMDYARIVVAPPAPAYDYHVAQIAVYEHDTVVARHAEIIPLGTSKFVSVYGAGSSIGKIRTFSCDANFENIATIDTETLTNSYGYYPSIGQISSTKYVVASQGVGENGFIHTFSIDANANNITIIDMLEQDTDTGYNCSLAMIDSTHFALAYCSTGFKGYIKTFSIDANADNITEIASLKYDDGALSGYYSSSLLKISSTLLILACNDANSDGFIRTFSIDGAYGSITQIDSLEIDIADFANASLVMIDATHYAVAYTGTGSDGFIQTFSVDVNADNIAAIDSLEFDTSDATYISMVLIDSTHLMVAYKGVDGDGFIKTFSFDAACDNLTEVYSLEYDTTNQDWCSLAQIDITHYALLYTGESTHGYIKTFLMT